VSLTLSTFSCIKPEMALLRLRAACAGAAAARYGGGQQEDVSIKRCTYWDRSITSLQFTKADRRCLDKII
jgi:hypothetical protein